MFQEFPILRDFFQQLLDLGRGGVFTDQRGISGFDDNQMFQSDSGNQVFSFGIDNAVLTIQELCISLYDIVRSVWLNVIAQSGPVSDVIPVERGWYNEDLCRLFHYSIINGNLRSAFIFPKQKFGKAGRSPCIGDTIRQVRQIRSIPQGLWKPAMRTYRCSRENFRPSGILPQ